jgi:hypothetical protein
MATLKSIAKLCDLIRSETAESDAILNGELKENCTTWELLEFHVKKLKSSFDSVYESLQEKDAENEKLETELKEANKWKEEHIEEIIRLEKAAIKYHDDWAEAMQTIKQLRRTQNKRQREEEEEEEEPKEKHQCTQTQIDLTI